MRNLFNLVINALAISVTALFLPGVRVTDFFSAVLAALVLGVVNVFIKPVLMFLTLPINILTIGLFTLVINACLVLLAAKIVPGFSVDSFWWALIFGVVLSIVNAILHRFFRE
ncbi:phage holin family protein [Patescibacteria group bacterium]|nr:MAG: phage holin family protein [Patescibacteria group bacterium]